MDQPIAILTADWHLRETVPECRTDKFIDTQFEKLEYIYGLQQKHNYIPVLVAGDIFHKATYRFSPKFMSRLIEVMEGRPTYAIPGNHDLPGHKMDRITESNIWFLRKALFNSFWLLNSATFVTKANFNIVPFPFKQETYDNPIDNEHQTIAIVHEFVYVGKKPWPGCTYRNGSKMLKNVKGYDLILTGDNHQSFTYKNIVNPGSITRQSAAQEDHKPSVYLWYGGDNVKRQVIPHEEPANSMSRDHLDKIQLRDERIQAFVKRLPKKGKKTSLSFEENMEQKMRGAKLKPIVKRKINEAMEG